MPHGNCSKSKCSLNSWSSWNPQIIKVWMGIHKFSTCKSFIIRPTKLVQKEQKLILLVCRIITTHNSYLTCIWDTWGGGSLPLMLCIDVRKKGVFMGAIYLLIWILRNPLSRKEKQLFQIFNNLQVIIKENLDYFNLCSRRKT